MSRRSKVALAGAVVGLVLLVAHYAWASTFWSQAVFFARMETPWFLPLVVSLGLLAFTIKHIHFDTKDQYGYQKKDIPSRFGRGIALYSLFVLGLVATFAAPYFTGYFRAVSYEATTVVSDDMDKIDFQIRTPYDVAQKRVGDAAGALTGAKKGTTKYTASSENSEYTMLVSKSIDYAGYKAVVDLNKDSCLFDDKADRRMNGPLFGGHDLLRLIQKQARYNYVDENDVYGYCDGDVPMVVAPLTEIDGFWVTREVPAGIALYNGATGALEIKREVKPGEIPGPVYPKSLSAEVRKSLTASGSFWEWHKDYVGYITTENDGDDPNAGNRSEFGMLNAENKGHYVSPLVPNGDASISVVAVGMQQYGSVKAGEFNSYEVIRYVDAEGKPAPQQAHGLVKTDIPGKFENLNWSNGMSIYEIAPLKGDTRIVTLGVSQAMQYRVVITTEEYCLQEMNGTQIRCVSTSDDTKAPVDGEGTVEGTVTIRGDLGSMTDKELADLAVELATEIQSRLPQE